ncbi:Protein H2A.7 [Acorus calamus]|uniref:Protein H2A.7 n=1 Tax=Acorus calamus TaxID=4465 RepID=A0AAV9C4Y0_ACOCL|nr:Protein H2A.7 [Acorus calamus]
MPKNNGRTWKVDRRRSREEGEVAEQQSRSPVPAGSPSSSRPASAPTVYLAAVLEYLADELAVRNDEELSKLLGMVTIANGGVMLNIHNLLLSKKTGSSEAVPAEED